MAENSGKIRFAYYRVKHATAGKERTGSKRQRTNRQNYLKRRRLADPWPKDPTVERWRQLNMPRDGQGCWRWRGVHNATLVVSTVAPADALRGVPVRRSRGGRGTCASSTCDCGRTDRPLHLHHVG